MASNSFSFTRTYARITALLITVHKATLLHTLIPLVLRFFFLRVYNNVDELECSLLDRVSFSCCNITLLTIILLSTQTKKKGSNNDIIFL